MTSWRNVTIGCRGAFINISSLLSRWLKIFFSGNEDTLCSQDEGKFRQPRLTRKKVVNNYAYISLPWYNVLFRECGRQCNEVLALCTENKLFEVYSESKNRFAVKKSSNALYKILLLSDSTLFKLFFHIFAAIFEALIVAGHKFLYTLLTECGRLRC